MNQQPIETEQDGHVLWLSMNQPEKRNALSSDMINALSDALEQGYGDPQTRVIILRANGPVFSAGHDLSEMSPRDGEDKATTGSAVTLEVSGPDERLQHFAGKMLRELGFFTQFNHSSGDRRILCHQLEATKGVFNSPGVQVSH